MKKLSKRARERTRGTFAEVVIHEWPPLRESPMEQVRVRVVQSPQGLGVDLRQFLVTAAFQGFTRRGLRLDWEALQMLKEQLPAIEKCLREASQAATLATPAPTPTSGAPEELTGSAAAPRKATRGRR